MQALAIDETALGPVHPGVATDLNNLAGLYYHQRKFVEAEALLNRAQAIWEATLGPSHPNVGTVMENRSKLLRAMNHEAEATELETRARSIRDLQP